MAGIPFHSTGYGRRFFDAQLPELIKNLGRIASEMAKKNEPSSTPDKVYVVVELASIDQGHNYGGGGVQGVYVEKEDAEAWVEEHRPNYRSFAIKERKVRSGGDLGPSDEDKA
jgi:hypothetical protein